MAERDRSLDIIPKDFNRQYKTAVDRGALRVAQLPKAASARFDARSARMVFEMQNGVTLFVPVGLIQGLNSGDSKTLADFELVSDGSQIHWHGLDVQFYIEDLLKGVFGTPSWMSTLEYHMAEIGRKGGSSNSPSKAAASRENGKKGGRPPRKAA